jgi:hypothetical protein
MGKIVKASQEYECDRCFGIIKAGETYEYTLVTIPQEIRHFGGSTAQVCHFHDYNCLEGKIDMYDLQEIDLHNITRHGQSNNL